MADELLCTLILASEKASNIARLCRENEDLFSLLIEKKGERNNEIDFKTFADVFIQQVIVKEVSSKFGTLGDRVKGEENNQFTNTLGETVTVEISCDAGSTAAQISKVLGDHKNAAKLLANAAHDTTPLDMETLLDSEARKNVASSGLDLQNLGIWVDPIDCTSQYVLGIEDSISKPSGVYEAGLQCVLVLIGVHCLDTGLPVMGIVNQPFHKKATEKKWCGRCSWGFSFNGVNQNNIPAALVDNSKPLVVLSLHDALAQETISQMSDILDICLSRGAGYKCITVLDHLSEVFLYTSNGSYKWDTCGPHAILLSCGGGIAVLKDAIISYNASSNSENSIKDILKSCQVLYCEPKPNTSSNWKANSGGILVYNGSASSTATIKKIMQAISSSVL